MEQFSLKTNWSLAERLVCNQGEKKDLMGCVWREENQSGRELRPWEGTQKKREITQAEILPASLGSECFEPHVVHLSPGVQCQEDESLRLVEGPVGLIGRLKEGWAPLTSSMHMFAYSWNRAEREDWNSIGGWTASCDCPGMRPSLNLATATGLLASWHSSTGVTATVAKGWELGCETQMSPDLKQCLSRAVAAISGAYIGSAPEAVPISDYSWTATAWASTHAKCLLQPLLLQHCSPLRWGCRCWE